MSETEEIEFSEIRNAMTEGGFKPDEIERTIRLLKLSPTDKEKKRWIEVGILTEDGKIIVDEDEIENFGTVVIALWNLTYDGILEKSHITIDGD